MVRRFRTLKNVKLSEETCEEKWRNLVRTYKKNLIRVKKRGTGAIRWPYFWKMHEIMGSAIVDNEKGLTMPYIDVTNKPRLTETVTPELRPNNRSLSMNDQFIEYTEDILEDTIKEQHENLSSMISDLRDKQNKMLQEIIDLQNKKIEELHQEQLNIKTLLTQLLQKFPWLFVNKLNRSLSVNDQFIKYTEDMIKQHENLSNMMSDLRDKQNKIL